jgi:bifunctional non-homologous end joining protein LigD
MSASAGPPQSATKQELAALEAMTKDGVWEVGGESVSLTNLDKVSSWPATKRDLIRYYVTVAPVLLPHLYGRALNLSRWPDGVNGHTFWQKQIPDWAPDWIARWDYPEAGSSESHTYLVADRVATMANRESRDVDLHPWTSRTIHRNPTFALIDDPGERRPSRTSWPGPAVPRGAHLKVSGCPRRQPSGHQIWVPVRLLYLSRDEFLGGGAVPIGAAAPTLVGGSGPSGRGAAGAAGCAERGQQTLVALRRAPGHNAAVSTPITWDEPTTLTCGPTNGTSTVLGGSRSAATCSRRRQPGQGARPGLSRPTRARPTAQTLCRVHRPAHTWIFSAVVWRGTVCLAAPGKFAPSLTGEHDEPCPGPD